MSPFQYKPRFKRFKSRTKTFIKSGDFIKIKFNDLIRQGKIVAEVENVPDRTFLVLCMSRDYVFSLHVVISNVMDITTVDSIFKEVSYSEFLKLYNYGFLTKRNGIVWRNLGKDITNIAHAIVFLKGMMVTDDLKKLHVPDLTKLREFLFIYNELIDKNNIHECVDMKEIVYLLEKCNTMRKGNHESATRGDSVGEGLHRL